MKKLIELKNLQYSYPGAGLALKDINLEIQEGEMMAIIGQNGSGKSTLLNIINALVFPEAGELIFRGNSVTEKSMKNNSFAAEFRQSMAYVFQNQDVQLFCPTVMDELMFAPLQLGMPKEEAFSRANQTLAALEIESIKERPVIMLSGGEKKRVAIASVLTMNPDILLMDEPLAGLDPKTQTFITDLLVELNNAGKTIIFTTHQLDLIDHLQPRVAVLSEDHALTKTASANEILNDEEFLISVNLLHEHLHKHGEDVHKHYHSHYVFHKH